MAFSCLQISESLSASHAMQQRVITDPSITIQYNSTVTAIQGNGTHVTGATILNKKTGEETTMALDGIFIAIGLKPNTKPFEGQIQLRNGGYIQIENNTHTSVEGVFAAGDVFDYRYRQAVTSAGSGCMAALDAERYLSHLNII